ncbi:hypothetical protein [Xenorhabdus bovienii]|uniref:Phage tail protein C-terminal domain-containing protein n=1 Tax=Xenorhabdus bovienii str. Intermedium TaxID=1379677 RepID=A0A077QHK9_XENBV|nr:hypothetical protein [Xenorhabdus bovienii]CDH31761.1 conserved hypothetical protein [Xenorhabdus bovienii str. Intermedium]
MIYSDGTTNLVSGSAIVRGAGTKWKSNINGIAAGQIISIQSGNTVIQNVIRSVNSDTELVLAFAPSVSLDNANYVISTTVPDTVSDGVRHICAINAYIILFLQNMDRWMSESGKVEVEMPNGQKVTLDSIRALQAGVEGKLDESQVVQVSGGSTKQVMSQYITTQLIVERAVKSDAVMRDFSNGGIQSMKSELLCEQDFTTKTGIWVQPEQPQAWGMIIKNGRAVLSYKKDDIWKGELNHPEVSGTLWCTGNADFDGNGFLKKTSPIIQIYPEGQFETNDESEGATVTKLGLGHYKISGILGYNSDGAWGVHGGISVPRDVNGNELVYVDDKVLPDGAIEIKVTHRQNAHMPARLQNRRMKSVDEQTHYTDDEPCDLPAGTRLDVRVQMPEDSIWNQKQVLVPDPQQEYSVTSAVNK